MSAAENAICEILRNGKPVGLGFALDTTHVLTCAHVLNTALGRDKRDASDPGDVTFVLRFPIGQPDRDSELQGGLSEWLPSDPARFDSEDLAVLDLEEPVPAHVPVLLPASAEASRAVQMWGPQPSRPNGAHVTGRLIGSVKGVRRQINVDGGPFRVRPGFSGGPVWRQDTSEVAGILVACGDTESAVDAYLLGVEQISHLWPQWRKHDRDLELGRTGDRDLIRRVEEAIRFLPDLADAEIRRTRRGGGEHLLVTRRVPVGARTYREDRPVLAQAGEVSESNVQMLLDITRHYRQIGFEIVRPTLVYTGSPATETLRERASQKGIEIQSLAAFQTGIDLDAFAAQQQLALGSDPRYPEKGYVAQQFREPPTKAVARDELREKLLVWLAEPEGNLVVVLAPFGHGKTYLLYEIARHIHENSDYPAKPVFVRLSELDRSFDLDTMVSWQLRQGGQRRIDFDWLAYMRREGRLVLLLDGFDELARRVSYDHAAAHLEQILRAAEGRAKIVLTSRREFFLSDRDTEMAFGQQLSVAAGRRMVIIADFGPAQIRQYLAARGDEEAADRWLSTLSDLGLLDLAANPRMLGMLIAIGQEKLAAGAREGTVTKAWVFDEVLKTWLTGEYERANPHGTNPAPWIEAMRGALTGLACRFWRDKLPWLTIDEMRPFAERLTAVRDADRLTPDEALHRLGSGTLLVRVGDGQFEFLHRSMMEWLVTQRIADLLNQGARGQLDSYLMTPLSPVQIELLGELAYRETLTAWTRGAMADNREGVRGNAISVSQQLGISLLETQVLRGQDLRGQDFAGRDLADADLTDADLTDAILIGADLSRANLTSARLLRARLDQALLDNANLTDADFSQARLDNATLVSATVDGANFTDATLCAANLRGIDWSGVGDARRAATLAAHIDPDGVEVLESFGAAAPHTHPQLHVQSGGTVTSVSLHPSEDLIAAASGTVITIWNRATGRPLRQLVGHTNLVRSVAYSPDGQHLASASGDRTVRIWNTTTGALARQITHDFPVGSVAYSPDGRHLASASGDQTVRIWNTTTGTQTRQLGHLGWVHAAAYSPDGKHLAASSGDGLVRIWNTTGTVTIQFLHPSAVRLVAYSHDGQHLATGSSDGTLRIWNTTTGTQTHQCGHTNTVQAVAYSHDGQHLATGNGDRTIRIWNTTTGAQTTQLHGHANLVRSVAYSPDCQHLASSDDDTVRIWNATTGTQTTQLDAHTASFQSMTYSPDGQHLATGSSDGTLRIWNTTTGALEHQFDAHTDWVRSLAYSPDGQHLATGGDDGTICIWNTTTGTQTTQLDADTDWVHSVAYSPDGQYLATGGDDHTVRIWNTTTGTQTTQLHGHTNWVRSLAYSPDGQHLATGSDDGTIRVWSMTAPDTMIACLLPLADGWAAFGTGGRYKFEGNPRNEFWWATGPARLDPGQPDAYEPTITRVGIDDPL